MLQLALNYGQHLGESWKYVLKCISKIDFYFHYSPPSNKSSPPVDSPEYVDLKNCEVLNENIDPNILHHIFSKSRKFEMEEILDFITCLCKIS